MRSSPMVAYFLDANIFLRFLTGDDEKKAKACRALFQSAIEGEIKLQTHPLILAEVVWVLESYYGLAREEIALKLDLILNTPKLTIADSAAFSHAVVLYSSTVLDLADCFAAALAKEKQQILVSYDRDFDKLPEVTRMEPNALG